MTATQTLPVPDLCDNHTYTYDLHAARPSRGVCSRCGYAAHVLPIHENFPRPKHTAGHAMVCDRTECRR